MLDAGKLAAGIRQGGGSCPMRRVIVICAVLACSSFSTVRAQSWVEQVLPERAFDFGTVAKGSKVRHAFRLVNTLNQEVRIGTWETKCGCTEVRVGAQVIPPGTQTTIEAVIDTTRFVGTKHSGLTLVLTAPSFTRIDLNIQCFIRADLTLSPGLVDLGVVQRSSSTKPAETITLSYSGGTTNWGVTRMQTRSTSVTARLQEQGRAADGRVQYTLTATLDPAGLSGFFKDEITLFTNDPNSPTIPVAVVANVQSALTVSPSPMLLGPVKAGSEVVKTLLVRSSRPFKVTGVKPSRDEISPTVPSEESKAVHTLTIKLKAPAQPGPFHAAVEIATDLENEPPAKLTVFATVVP
jgi:Protein of unknown function (DUF1573)